MGSALAAMIMAAVMVVLAAMIVAVDMAVDVVPSDLEWAQLLKARPESARRPPAGEVAVGGVEGEVQAGRATSGEGDEPFGDLRPVVAASDGEDVRCHGERNGIDEVERGGRCRALLGMRAPLGEEERDVEARDRGQHLESRVVAG